MHCPWLSTIAVVCFSCLFFPGAASGGDVQQSDVLVRRALESEIDGDVVLRGALLRSAAEADPASKPARWHAGQIEHEGEWTGYQHVPDRLAQNAAIEQYRAVRNNYEMTRNGQLRLADWCRDHKLPQRERAHLTAALALSNNSNDPVLRARLGFQLVDGVWTTQEEIDNQKQTLLAEQQHLKSWRPRLRRLSTQLAARRKEIREQALAELKTLRDPALIPALEATLLGGGLQRERLLIELLSGIESHQAADALARVAVFSSWDAVRRQAAEELHARPIETYAPELIRSLRTPIDSRFSLYIGAGGVHLLRSHVSETQYVREEVVSRSSTFIRPVILGSFETPEAARQAQNRLARATANAAIEAELGTRAVARNAELASEMISTWNRRLCGVLREGTGVELPDDAEQWWTWWCDYNQMEEEEKETRRRRYYRVRTEDISVADPTVVSRTPEQVPERRPCECLVAGTPVWTDRGFVAVEEIQIGDLVLAKHPATGELAYQPVLRTTVRDEEPTMTVATEQGEITATGGHTFWVSGRGWTKLRMVKPGERFHGVEGPVEIIRLEPAGQAKTYNLIVADSHTYFAGRALVLSHDLTFGEPVDALLPGLQRQWSAEH